MHTLYYEPVYLSSNVTGCELDDRGSILGRCRGFSLPHRVEVQQPKREADLRPVPK